MLTGIDTKATVTFIPSAEKDTVKPTTFIIGTLTNRDKMNLMGDAVDSTGQADYKKLSEKAFDIVRIGVKGILNYNGQDTVEITEDIMNGMDLAVLMELFSKVLEVNFVSADTKKN